LHLFPHDNRVEDKLVIGLKREKRKRETYACMNYGDITFMCAYGNEAIGEKMQ
jgi:hypothetical protein